MDSNSRDDLVQRLRAHRDELPLPSERVEAVVRDDDPGSQEVVRRWVAALGLKAGNAYTPRATVLGPRIAEWARRQGWDVPVPPTVVGQVMRQLGFRKREYHRLLGFRVDAEQARAMWTEAGLEYPARPLGNRAPRYEPRRKEPMPLLRELPGPKWTLPLLDSAGAVWPGLGWPGRVIRKHKGSPQGLAKTASRASQPLSRHHGHPEYGRLWWRLPKDRAWLAHVAPDARVGQPGVLCWCCWAKAERAQLERQAGE